jgi:hypothetical protein
MSEIIDRACQYLIAKAHPKSTGKCAAAVRSAFDFALGKAMTKTESAKNYGPIYEKLGFKKVFSYPGAKKLDYKEQKGDICIIQYEPHGHICVRTDKAWISDFVQIDKYGGNIRKKDPAFDIYRFLI